MTSPLLGTPYILSQSRSSSQPHPSIPITPTICQNLSSFKNILRQSRQWDDSIQLRLNRAAAISRSSIDGRGSTGIIGDKECDAFWNELIDRWEERKGMMMFCDEVVRQGVEGKEERPQVDGLDRELQLRGRGEDERIVKVSEILIASVKSAD